LFFLGVGDGGAGVGGVGVVVEPEGLFKAK
jgi:hypothetical protein